MFIIIILNMIKVWVKKKLRNIKFYNNINYYVVILLNWFNFFFIRCLLDLVFYGFIFCCWLFRFIVNNNMFKFWRV